jgi:hypothetical protein
MFDKIQQVQKSRLLYPDNPKIKKTALKYRSAIGKYNLRLLAMQTDLPNNKCIW